LRFQANAAITEKAQFDTRPSEGTRKARTPFSSCSITFSCWQRALAWKVTSAAARSLADTLVT